MTSHEIAQLLSRQPQGFSLAQAFYTDPDIYERDVERIFLRSWLYAGHQSEIPNVGDWFLFDFADESVIVVRSAKDRVNALVNVCRHRGSRICAQSRGRSKRLTCGYHGWTYDLQGKLRAAGQMGESFDRSGIRLKRIHVELLDGLIFVNFAEEPAPFQTVREGLSEVLRPYRLEQAKVAHRQSYPIDANWKLAVENYCECYHCAPAHPEYSRGHSIAHPHMLQSGLNEKVRARAALCGLSDRSVDRAYLHASGFGNDHGYDRYPLLRGHVTGSEDGQPVAPLLGEIRDYDGGATDLQVGPVTFGLMYCDHVVMYRFTPLGRQATDCDISWLVRADAQAGRDYDPDRLTWLWDVTTHADKAIIERNQQGVNSRYYEPGPLSRMEDYTLRLIDWYLETMGEGP